MSEMVDPDGPNRAPGGAMDAVGGVPADAPGGPQDAAPDAVPRGAGAGGGLTVVPLAGLPEVRPGDDLARLLLEAVRAAGLRLADGDVLAVTSKVVAKAEGRLLPLPADPAARERARNEAVAAETVRVVARRDRLVIAETRQGLVGANALVDASNAGGDALVLLPRDPDASAARLRAAIAAAPCRVVAVTPIVGGAPVRGMADRLLPAWGVEVSARGVAGLYAGLADAFVLDTVDADQAGDVAGHGLEPVVVPTLMHTVEDAAALAKAALELAAGWRPLGLLAAGRPG